MPSGDLEFLGRIDDQVKVRGFRVELGEVEARLAAHPGVASAVVTVRGDRLVGYVVPAGSARPGVSELRGWCAVVLPEYMVPAAVVVLDGLPLTPNGKVDRRVLPEPDGDRPDLAAGYVAPGDDIEALVAGIWAEVLGLDRVGVHDNFFDLGGHSLLVTRVVVAARARGLELLPKDILKTPTVAGLSLALRRSGATSTTPSTPEIVRLNGYAPDRPSLFCAHEIGGRTSAYVHLANQLDGRVNVLGIEAAAEPSGDLTEQAAHYLDAIRAAHAGSPVHLAGWSYGGLVAMAIGRQAEAAGLGVGLLVLIDTVLPDEPLR